MGPPPAAAKQEIGPADLVELVRLRAGWVAVAAVLGAAIGAAYMLVESSSARDPLAGAAAGLVLGALWAGWIEWGPRRARPGRNPGSEV